MLSIETVRSMYSNSDPVHGFDHVLRVYKWARLIAQAEGADLEIVEAAALLHDAEIEVGRDKMDSSARELHQFQSAKIARKILICEGWGEERIQAVEHCILSHRFRDETQTPQSLEAKVLYDADKLDSIGAIGIARAIGYAVSRGQPIFFEPSEDFLNRGQTQNDEPHSAYHEYLFKLKKIKDRLYTSSGRSIAEERHDFMVAFFERLSKECTVETLG